MLYGKLDELRERTSKRLAVALTDEAENDQAKVERDAAAARYTERLGHLDAAENGLCFGRLDFRDGEHFHIGRIGITDDEGDYEPLLLDWRAPAARPFYLATAAAPGDVRRRRHIRTSGRTVTAVHDETLDPDSAGPEGLVGEAALLAALDAGRTGRMGDIVETIQAEQDRIIRSGHRGVLVVQGGPGTGKTAVALHRAAFLLYTHRDVLSRRGVLIVGPNTTFLRYIGEVLPSLGESGVLLSTVAELFPGVLGDRVEPDETVAVKGRAAMAEVLAGALADRQWVPDEVLEVAGETDTLQLDGATCRGIRDHARESLLPHNEARRIVVTEVIGTLAGQVVRRLGGTDLVDDGEIKRICADLIGDEGVQAAIDTLWPSLSPQRFLDDLFGSPERLASAAPELTERERAALLREPGGWSAADVPLLDEAAELLGADERLTAVLAEREHRRRVEYAQGVLEIAHGSRSTDHDVLSAADLVDAEWLAARHEAPDHRTTAERAAADRSWTFGHVIVDEAQELSPMAWRMLMRRCPTRWMTLVGDVAQTGDPAGTSSWEAVLDPYVRDRWRLERLNVNYRMPAEVMAVAADVLAALGTALEPPRSVRETGVVPWHTGPDALAEIVAAEAALPGTLAVIAPEGRLADLAEALPDAVLGDPESPFSILGVRQAKGLEFDSVVLVDPARIVAESARGLNDLYVALTRTTQRLGVVHSGDLPATLARLRHR
ncbi:AAA family ATPase [Streptosporangium sp. KLBMP 9127]|nr:AAA family ATPase [Streptosporangium sp. KLBMP 9127]